MKQPEFDIAKMTTQLMDDLKTYEVGMHQNIITLYLNSAYELGSEHAWWHVQEKALQNEPEPFDYEWSGGDK